MFFGYGLLMLVSLNPLLGELSQDCRFYGQSCIDNFSCCGGCCLKGICKDTYMDCRKNSVDDPCAERYCPEDQVCFTYQPPGCKGCGHLIECRTMPTPKDLRKNRTYTHYHLLNSSTSLGLGLLLYFCTFIAIFL